MSTTKGLKQMARDAIELNTTMEFLAIDHVDKKNQTVKTSCKSTIGNILEIIVKIINNKVVVEAEKQGIIYQGKVKR